MKQEIEKKYLLGENGVSYATDAAPRNLYPCRGQKIRQGYLAPQDLEAIFAESGHKPGFEICEARLRQHGIDFYLTFKSDGTLQRTEEEHLISPSLFEKYWPRTEGRRIKKMRLRTSYGKYLVEIDFYTDRDLIIAEIEFPTRKEAEAHPLLGKDITEEAQYKNKNLSR